MPGLALEFLDPLPQLHLPSKHFLILAPVVPDLLLQLELVLPGHVCRTLAPALVVLDGILLGTDPGRVLLD